MKNIQVSADRDYAIEFASDWQTNLREALGQRRSLIVTSKVLAERFEFKADDKDIVLIPDGEQAKDFATFEYLARECARRGLVRGDVLIAIGGGATTDLVGFVAASFMRGIDWIAVPTSLAGMVDAAIGGKTAIDIPEGKNLVGAFYSPGRVIIDPAFLTTLPKRDLHAGLAEVIKTGFVRDPEILNLVEDGYEKNMKELIFRSAAVKASVVSTDFKESFEREILNYGHTLGHAIENHSGYALRHGEAISIGLIFAAELGRRFGQLSDDVVEMHRSLLASLDLPSRYPAEAWNELYRIMLGDKKRKGANIRFVTLEDIGRPNRLETVGHDDLKNLYLEKIAG